VSLHPGCATSAGKGFEQISGSAARRQRWLSTPSNTLFFVEYLESNFLVSSKFGVMVFSGSTGKGVLAIAAKSRDGIKVIFVAFAHGGSRQ